MVNSIATLIDAVNLAQARGAYSVEQSAQIFPSLQKCTEFVNESNKNQEKEDSTEHVGFVKDVQKEYAIKEKATE